MTKNNLEQLVRSCKYDPERIGIAILRSLDYKVNTYRYSDACYVFDKTGKIVFGRDGGD